MRLRKDYTTHIITVIKLLQMTTGPVLEMGSGVFSTPLLHWLCAESRRRLETYEDNVEYFQFANSFRSRNHKIILVDDWDKIDIDKHWDVVLIDHEPPEGVIHPSLLHRRSIDAIRLKDQVDYIILHDSETDHYGYSKVYPHFKYIYHWQFCRPWTTVVSNFKDLENL